MTQRLTLRAPEPRELDSYDAVLLLAIAIVSTRGTVTLALGAEATQVTSKRKGSSQ